MPGGGARIDLWENPKENPAHQPEACIEKHLDVYDIDYAVLTGGPYAAAVHTNPDYASAYCSAFNDWTKDHWLSADPRFRASIHICPVDPQLAVKEIDRLGPDPAFVQVMMPAGARMPFGNRHYHPIYEACERHGLPVSVHFGGEGAGLAAPPTAAGYPTYYLEMRMARPQIAQAHVTSLVVEGVFEKFPDLHFIFVEMDTFWLPGLMWHLDLDWRCVARLHALGQTPAERVHPRTHPLGHATHARYTRRQSGLGDVLALDARRRHARFCQRLSALGLG